MKNSLFIVIMFCASLLAQSKVYCQTFLKDGNLFDLKTLPKFNARGDLIITFSLNTYKDTTPDQIRDFEFGKLTTSFDINNNIKKAEIEPTGSGISRTYTISQDNTGFTNSIRNTNWNSITYSINYSLKTINKSGDPITYINPSPNLTSTSRNGLNVRDIEMKLGDTFCTINIKSNVNGVTILKYNTGLKLDESSQSIVALMQNDTIINSNEYSTIKLYPTEGIELNKNRNYILQIASSLNNIENDVWRNPKTIQFRQGYQISKIDNNLVIGSNSVELIATTTTSGKTLRLIFKKNPLSLGKIDPIEGEKLNSNQFKFKIPSDYSSFKFDVYVIDFSGESLAGEQYGNDITTNYTFEKKKNNIKNISQEQDSLVRFNVELSNKTIKPVYLYIEGKNAGQLSSKDDLKYAICFSPSDIILTDLIPKNSKEIKLKIGVDDEILEPNYLCKLKIIDKKQAISDLNKISGSKKKRQEEIKKYLTDKGFEGDFTSLTQSVLVATTKKNNEQSWSNVWTTASKLIPTVIGTLMLFI